MDFLRKLPIPMAIKAEYPLSERCVNLKEERDKEIADIIKGESNRFLMIVGPCSADREDAVMDFVTRLATVAEEVKDRILVIPRIYCNKPRTTGKGYKGMAHQPDPNKEPDMLEGLVSIRKMHLRVIEETGLTSADEMLYPDDYRYLSDLISYLAVGARSVENQQHRLTASGLSIPVGMKNPTSGDLNIMINALTAAQTAHMFIYRGWEVVSHGNPLAHAILRGSVDRYGKMSPNYHYEDLMQLFYLYNEGDLVNQSAIVDANHCNSGKEPFEQIRICKEVLHSRRYSKDIESLVKGVMVESYLEDGCQSVGGSVYGQSITDPCLGWQKTERLIYELADQL
jgi:3-deoxy-7-phosphoheptulonate synthase